MSARSWHGLWIVAVIISPALAQTPGMVGFQGLIKGSSGAPIPDGTVELQFRIFDAEAGGSIVDMNGDGVADSFDVTVVNVVAAGGFVATKFGPVFPTAFANFVPGETRWLEVTVDGAPLSRVEMATPPGIAQQVNRQGTDEGVLTTDDPALSFRVPGSARIEDSLFASFVSGLSPLRFQTAGTTRMTILDDGKVGIGETSPNSQLHVDGDGIAPSLRVQVNGASKLTVASNGGVTVGTFQNNPPANGLYVWGNVGVGTSDPGAHDLAVVGSGTGISGATLNVENTSSGSGISANFRSDGTDSTVVIGNDGTGDLIRAFSSFQPCCPLFQVTRKGWLGMGMTTSPIHPVEVGTDNTNGNGAYLSAGGTWQDTLIRRSARNFGELDTRDILERVANLPITRWQSESEPEVVEHIGPVAEDFNAAFGTGSDDRYISKIDAQGVALAAIQGLHDLVQEQEREIEELRTEIAKVKEIVIALAEQNGRER